MQEKAEQEIQNQQINAELATYERPATTALNQRQIKRDENEQTMMSQQASPVNENIQKSLAIGSPQPGFNTDELTEYAMMKEGITHADI